MMQRMMMSIAVAAIVIHITAITIIIVIIRAINSNAVIYVTMMVFGHSCGWIIDAVTSTIASASTAATAAVTNIIAVKIA